jgi:adenylate cyclase
MTAQRLPEYKQVSVLFADVVRSMDIAASVGPERLREIMTDVMNRSTNIIECNGGTMNSFTGDGLMALFGAPAALEDHAFLACLAAIDIQHAVKALAEEVQRRDGISLQLRIGINSGQVITGEIGSSPASYTATGGQVGFAQRMESVAPPGGVMVSEASARLVEDAVVLGDTELVRIKNVEDPVPVRPLLGIASRARSRRNKAHLIGRERETETLAGLLTESLSGTGRAASVVGPAGIGKSRLIEEVTSLANNRGADVFFAFCQSHTRNVPFFVVSQLLRAVFGIDESDAANARGLIRKRLPEVGAEDLALLHDLLGIRSASEELPPVDPQARRRRLARTVRAAVATRRTPSVYVVEDVHWIDEVSESMLADLATELSRSPALVLITHRPDYKGALDGDAIWETILLAPLDESQGSALTATLLGRHPSIAELATQIAEQAAGNPFFAEEMVRDLAERKVLEGGHGRYMRRESGFDVGVPATVQATIAARIDRLDWSAKQTLNAAAVIGSRFSADLLADVHNDPSLSDLIDADLVTVVDSESSDYTFRHPLIRAVAYESQLKSIRAQLHRQLAGTLERRQPDAAAENAALIATHFEAAGDLRDAYDWHMRAAGWFSSRDIAVTRASWQHARHVADQLPEDEPNQVALRAVPRAMLCGTIWLSGGAVDDVGFNELRELCDAGGDRELFATGMAGMVMALAGHNRNQEATKLAAELAALLDEIGKTKLTTNLLPSAAYAWAQVGGMAESLRLVQRAIDLADDDGARNEMWIGSPLARATMMRGTARLCLGIEGWRTDYDDAVAMGVRADQRTFVSAVMYRYIVAVPIGALAVGPAEARETAEALTLAEQVGDDHMLALARLVRGVVLVHQGGRHRDEGIGLLKWARDEASAKGFTLNATSIVDLEIARERASRDDFDGAIDLCRAAIDDMFHRGAMYMRGLATSILVEALLKRGAAGDLQAAQAAIDRVAEVPVDPGFVLHEIPLLRLRALVAREKRDDAGCQALMNRYRDAAKRAGFEPLVAEPMRI